MCGTARIGQNSGECGQYSDKTAGNAGKSVKDVRDAGRSVKDVRDAGKSGRRGDYSGIKRQKRRLQRHKAAER